MGWRRCSPLRIENLGKSKLLRFTEKVYEIAKQTVPTYSGKYSKKTFTQHQLVTIICLKVRENETYEGIVDRLIEEFGIRKALDLDEVPHPSTVCKAFERLESAVWRVIHLQTLDFFDLSGITGVDSSGLERNCVSHHYTKRSKLHIKQLKTTLLVDTEENPVVDVHITTTRKHDTKIGPQIVERSADLIDILLGDKGYDDRKDRERYRELGIRPIIKYREFTPLQKAWNTSMDDELYSQRNQNESVNSAIKRKYGGYVRSKKWYKQFREVIVKCLVYNIDRAIQLQKI